MKLYYMPGACSLAGHIVLEWLGKPYETQKMSRTEIKEPAYLKINPQGMVPTLTDGDAVIIQNSAILEYLAEHDPSGRLLGGNTAIARANVRHWLGFVNSDIHKTFSLVFGTASYIQGDTAQDELRNNAINKLVSLFGFADAHLAGKNFLGGEAPSIADAYLYVVLRWAKAKEVDLSQYKHLTALFNRMSQDPGVKTALAAEGLI